MRGWGWGSGWCVSTCVCFGGRVGWGVGGFVRVLEAHVKRVQLPMMKASCAREGHMLLSGGWGEVWCMWRWCEAVGR